MQKLIGRLSLIAVGLLLALNTANAGKIHPVLEAIRLAREGARMDKPELGAAAGFYWEPMPASALDSLFDIQIGSEGLTIPVFITTTGATDLVSAQGIQVNSHVGNLYTAHISIGELNRLADDPNVVKVEPSVRGEPELDVSLPDMKVTNVWSTFGYDGLDVIIGIVDDGIDINNNDFKDATTGSRILNIWDQRASGGTPPSSYSYGREWTKQQIDQGTCTHTPYGGHGTHVAGIAASNGRNTNQYVPAGTYKGVAPKAELVVVATDNDASHVVDGLLYIADKAAAANKPWVTNMSLGWWWGPRNGTSTFEQFVGGVPNQFTGGGRVIVKSAGNENAHDQYPGKRAKMRHASKPGSGSIRLAGGASASFRSDKVTIEIWYPEGEPYRITVTSPDGRSYGPYAANQGTGDPGYGYRYWDPSHPEDTTVGDGFVLIHNDHWAASGDWSDPFPFATDQQIFIYITDFLDQSNGYYYHMDEGDWTITMDNGSGRWDAYIYTQQTAGTAAFLYDNDNAYRITEPGNANNIITVGSYNTRRCWPAEPGPGDYCVGGNNVYWFLDQESYFSSRGPTRDGRLKPEILAPGSIIVSTRAAGYNPDPLTLLAKGGLHWGSQGTSMAAPHITGLVALMLDKNPNLAYNDIINCISNNADPDGHANALEAAKCVPDAIEGEEVLVVPNSFSLSQNYPNPFNAGTTIQFEVSPVDDAHSPQHVRVDVLNLLGQVVAVLTDDMLRPGSYAVHWDGASTDGKAVASGIYLYRCTVGEASGVQKMVLLK